MYGSRREGRRVRAPKRWTLESAYEFAGHEVKRIGRQTSNGVDVPPHVAGRLVTWAHERAAGLRQK